MAVIHTQGSFFRRQFNLATKCFRPALEIPMACLPTVESSCWQSSHACLPTVESSCWQSSHWRFLACPYYSTFSMFFCLLQFVLFYSEFPPKCSYYSQRFPERCPFFPSKLGKVSQVTSKTIVLQHNRGFNIVLK